MCLYKGMVIIYIDATTCSSTLYKSLAGRLTVVVVAAAASKLCCHLDSSCLAVPAWGSCSSALISSVLVAEGDELAATMTTGGAALVIRSRLTALCCPDCNWLLRRDAGVVVMALAVLRLDRLAALRTAYLL